MASQNSYYINFQNKNPKLPFKNDHRVQKMKITSKNNNINMIPEYYPQYQYQQQQQSRQLVYQFQEINRNPIQGFMNQNHSLYQESKKQIDQNRSLSSSMYSKRSSKNQYQNNIVENQNQSNNTSFNNQIGNPIIQQINISLYKNKSYKFDIFQRQQIESNIYESFLPTIHNQNRQIDLSNTRTKSRQKTITNDSLNCTQTSFMQTAKSTCYQCKQDITEKKINLVCWHNYHQECLIELIILQLQHNDQNKLPQCLCKININQSIINYLPNGQQMINQLVKKQIQVIFRRYDKILKKCPNCQFRFIYEKKLGKNCFCDICNFYFTIQ